MNTDAASKLSEEKGVILEGQIDLSCIIQKANGSWNKLLTLLGQLTDTEKKQHISNHVRPSATDNLHSHEVMKGGKTWILTFQLRWLDQFPWPSYSNLLCGGICRYCILFPEQPAREEGLGSGHSRAGVLVLQKLLFKGSWEEWCACLAQ